MIDQIKFNHKLYVTNQTDSSLRITMTGAQEHDINELRATLKTIQNPIMRQKLERILVVKKVRLMQSLAIRIKRSNRWTRHHRYKRQRVAGTISDSVTRKRMRCRHRKTNRYYSVPTTALVVIPEDDIPAGASG
jgi:hypothetical protein